MRNLEAKFRLDDHAQAERNAKAIGYVRCAVLNQRDTFFRVNHGKLKMREENGAAVLIRYHRGEAGALMLSQYEIVLVTEPAKTRAMLERALGTLAVVEKVRTLLTRDNVRLHLDRVSGLGDFGKSKRLLLTATIPSAAATPLTNCFRRWVLRATT